MSITTNVKMPPQRPSNMVEWIGLITSAIAELRGEDWFLDNNFTFKEVLSAINNDKDFYGSLSKWINTKLDAVDYNAADVLAKLKTVDGINSGLDADKVRGYVPVNKAGDSMSGYLTLHADPSSPLHATTKRYVDELIQGFSIKQSVRALGNVDIKLTGLQTIDGVSLKAGDRVLLVNQALRSENGIYVVATGAWVRSTDADNPENFANGSAVFVTEGTEYGDSGWVMVTDGPIVVGTTAIEFDKFSGAGQIIPVDGLYKDGNKMGLTDTGVVASTYTKVTVDVKGRVTKGELLVPSDIPVLDWSKITSGKPTTLGGYGITDGVNISEVVTTATPNKILKLNGSSKLPASITGNADGNAGSATKLQTGRNIAVSGAATGVVKFDGTADVTIPLTLRDSGIVAGQYTKVTYDEKGLAISGTTLEPVDIPVLDWSKITSGKPTTLGGYGITDGVNISEVVTVATPNKILKLNGSSKLPASITGNADGNAATASKWQTARTLSLSGAVTGSVSVDGSGNVNIATTYKNSGVTAGTYRSVTVDEKGNVTAGTNPTTVDEYGLTDAVKKTGDTMSGTLVTPRLETDLLLAYKNMWQRETYIMNAGSSAFTPTLETIPSTGATVELIDNPATNANFPFDASIPDYRFSRFTTWVFADSEVIIEGTLSSDDRATVYVNNELSAVGAGASTVTDVAIPLFKGWNQIDILHYEHTGSDALRFNFNFSEKVKYMTATPHRNSASGTLRASITGNAATASKWETARSFTLSGAVTGTVTFDGSNNVVLNTVYKNSGVAAGTYTKVTVDAKGDITSGTTLSASDIPNLDWSKITSGKPTTLAGYGIVDAANKVHDHAEFVRLDGSRNMTGQLTLAADPVQPMHATTKRYVDGLIQGIKARTGADVATTTNITRSGLQTIDGITLTAGMRVLVKDQTNAAQNGVFIAATGDWARADEYDEGTEFDGAIFVFVQKGSTQADTGWILDTDAAVTIGTTALNFTQFSRAGVTEGDGTTIVRNGNILSQRSGIATAGTYTKVTVDTYGRVTGTSLLSANDIPSLDWSKITSGKPTTLAGYGITDATPASHQSILASTTTTGHVKIGNGIAVSSGLISADVDGTSIILTGTSPNQKIAHADTSTQGSITNGGGTVIQSVGLDGMGHVTSLVSKALTPEDIAALPADEVVATATANKVLRLNASAKLPASITGNADGNAGSATKLQTKRYLNLSGDVEGSVGFDGTTNVTIDAELKDTGVAAGTYTLLDVDTDGRVTGASRPSRIEDLGISNAKDLDGTNAYITSNTGSTSMNKWTRLARVRLTGQYAHSNVSLLIMGGPDGGAGFRKAAVDLRVKQQSPMAQAPFVSLHVTERRSLDSAHFKAVTVTNTTSETIVELFMLVHVSYEAYRIIPVLQNTNASTLDILSNQGYVDSLPTGTVTNSDDESMAKHEQDVATKTKIGHIMPTGGLSVNDVGSVWVNVGDGITLDGSAPNEKVKADVDGTTIVLSGTSPNKKIAHADTSNQSSITNSGGTVIQSIAVDGMGHVTSMSSKALTPADVSAIPSSEMVTTATANKLLKLNGSGKLPASITGDADTVDGVHANQMVRNDTNNTSTELKIAQGGTFTDPHSGARYAAKFDGGVSTQKYNIGGKIDLVFNESEDALDIVFL
jgi:phage-related tail fiber protein